MKLFKNSVGRPSAETLKKRKIFCIAISVATILLVGGTAFTTLYFVNGITGKQKAAILDNCRIPYSTLKCSTAKNETIKKVQEMLKSLNYYTGKIDGNFKSSTVTAVKKFQKAYKLTADGYVGPETLEKLAIATDTDYFKVKYSKNGGSGVLNSQYNNLQTIIRGISTPISSTTLIKVGKTHVGYTGTTTINGKKYKYGCFDSNCVSGNQSKYSETEIKEREDLGETFYNYVYPIGTSLKNTAKSGQTVTLTAYYCSSNQKYDQKTSRCKKNSSTSSSASYNISGQMTGYSTKCSGCNGKGLVACTNSQHPFSSTKYKYVDSTYGTVRVVAASPTYSCGTIIEIQEYKEGTKSIKGEIAIVLDRGVSGNTIDLLVSTNDFAINKIGRQNIKFKVLRKGWN